MPTNTILRSFTRFGVIVLALALSAGLVSAQQRSPAAAPAIKAAHFSDQQLRSFAQAALQVRQIAMKARASLQAAKTPKARKDLINSAETRQIQAVKANGLTVSQYDAISLAARQDAKMRMKIGKYVKQALGKKN